MTTLRDAARATVRRRTGRVPAARLALLRAGFAAAERLAPGIGARWAFRLWVTLPDTGGRRRDDRPGPGRRSTVALPDGRTVAVESWGDGPPVYLVHGWGGWRGQMGPFVAPLVDAGFRVVAHDAPSHGDSAPGHLGPGRSSMLEMAETLASVTAAHGAPAGVVAHSGGGMATSAAIRDGLVVPRLVLVAASADPLLLVERLAAVVGFGPRTRRRVVEHTERLAGRPLADYDVRRLGAFAAHPAALVVHDRDDKEVPVSDGEQIAAAWHDADLQLTAGLGHRRILRDPAVVAAAVTFLSARA